MSEGEEVKRLRRRRVFVLISLTVVFVAMVLSGKMSWEALTSSGTLLGLMVIVLYKVEAGQTPSSILQWIKAQMERGFPRAGDVENRLRYYLGELGR